MELNVKRVREDAIIPTRGTDKSAGFDLYAVSDCTINPGEAKPIGTGIAVELTHSDNDGKDYGLFVYARSGLACKRGLAPANCVGVVDEDYRGEVIVYLRNSSSEVQVVKTGDRIAQLVVQEVQIPCINAVDELSDTERGTGGFGSTGK